MKVEEDKEKKEQKDKSEKQNELHKNVIQSDLRGINPEGIAILLTKEEVDYANQYFDNNKQATKLSKKTTEGSGVKYSVIKDNNNNRYALYSGAQKLGQGLYGSVKLAQNINTGEWVAVKIQVIDKAYKRDDTKEETTILAAIKNLFGIATRKSESSKIAAGSEKDYIFQKLIPGEQVKRILLDPGSQISSILNFSTKLFTEIKKLHDKDIVHGDPHWGNVLYNQEDNSIHLIDFGLTKIFDKSVNSPDEISIAKKRDIRKIGRNIKSQNYEALEKTELISGYFTVRLNLLLTKMSTENDPDVPSIEECIQEMTTISKIYEFEKKLAEKLLPKEKKILTEIKKLYLAKDFKEGSEKFYNDLKKLTINEHGKIIGMETMINWNLGDRRGNTALIKFIEDEDLESISFLINEMHVNVNISNNRGETPLMVAVDMNNLDLIKLLIENGADASMQDQEGKTALMIADVKCKDSPEILLYLKEANESQKLKMQNLKLSTLSYEQSLNQSFNKESKKPVSNTDGIKPSDKPSL